MSVDILNSAEKCLLGGFDFIKNAFGINKLFTNADNEKINEDSSLFIWCVLKLSNYEVGDAVFSINKIYKQNSLQEFAKNNFDIIPINKVNNANGYLNPGDLLLMDSSTGFSIVIFKNYDEKGGLHFIGTELSMGKKKCTIRYYKYLDNNDFNIFGVLRAKESFRTKKYKEQHGVLEETKKNVGMSYLAQTLANQIKYIFRQKTIECNMKWDDGMENASLALTYVALKNNFKNVTNLSFNSDLKIINIADLSQKASLYVSMKTRIAAQIPIKQSLADIYKFEHSICKNNAKQSK